MRPVTSVAMLLVLVLVVCACGGSQPSSTTDSTIAAPNLDGSLGIGASVAQYRRDEPAGVVQLKVVAGPDSPPRHITSAQLRWDGVTSTPAVEVDTALSAGRRVDLPAPLGEAVCASLDDVTPGQSPPPPPLGDGVVRLTLAGSDEQAGRTVDAPLLPEAEAPLARLFQHDCQRQSMQRAVRVGFAARWRRADRSGKPTAVGTLVITRGAAEQPITVASVNGSVLLDLSLDGGDGEGGNDEGGHGDNNDDDQTPAGSGDPTAAVPTLPAGSDRLAVSVRVTSSGRCDGHALGASSQTYQLQAAIAVGAADPVGVTVSPDDGGRAVLAQLIADACG